MNVVTCGQCGFAPGDWTVSDAVRTLHPLGPWWQEVTAGLDPAGDALLGVAEQSVAALHASGSRLFAALGVEATGPAPEPGPAGPQPSDPALAAVIDAIDGAARRIVGAVGGVPVAAWEGAPAATATLLELVHATTHDIRQAGRLVRAAGGGAPHAVGTVAAVNVSGGGVPKLAVAEAAVSRRGLAGDRQQTRKHHGRPWQALCLWSSEVIDRLVDEGHPIAAGAAGENVTISDLDWAALRPGTRLRLGTAEAELSLFALPCKKNAQWFADGDFNRMLHSRHPGDSRFYAWVVAEGVVRPGDEVVVEP